MALPKSQRRPNLIRLDPKRLDGLVAKCRRLERLAGDAMPQIVREANVEGLEWIQAKALENLRKSMRQARQPFRTGTLEEAISDPQYSAADGRGIRFFIDAKIRPDVPYYAALEYGDRSSVGRRVPFIFLSTGGGRFNRAGARKPEYSTTNQPDANRGTGSFRRATGLRRGGPGKGLRNDRIVGPREIDRLGGSDTNVRARRNGHGQFTDKTGKGHGGIRLVTITRPVPRYLYGTKAGEAFVAQGIYGTYLDRRIRSSGLSTESVKFILTGR